jgi:hypothetical protein
MSKRRHQTLIEPPSQLQLRSTATRDDVERKTQSQRYRKMPGQGRARIAPGSAVWALSKIRDGDYDSDV